MTLRRRLDRLEAKHTPRRSGPEVWIQHADNSDAYGCEWFPGLALTFAQLEARPPEGERVIVAFVAHPGGRP